MRGSGTIYSTSTFSYNRMAMATAEQIKSLIKSHFSDDSERFYRIALAAMVMPKEIHDRLMRITLSYLIEPGPNEIGWKDRYRYPSHLLRFDINSPGEPQEDFLRRINAAMRDDENGHPGASSASDYWLIGSKNRDKGTIHSDIWEGTAVDLSDSNLIAISPRIGRWNKRKHLNKANSQTRYALIVSIETPRQDVDIYTPVKTQIPIKAPIEITT